MPRATEKSGYEPDDAVDVEPSDAEVEAWAAEERQRRQAWLNGPTQAQKADWAARERSRRMAQYGADASGTGRRALGAEVPFVAAQRYMREAQLAAEGALNMLFSLSMRDVLDQLVQAGREWEEEYATRPTRRRIALDTEIREVNTSREPTRGTDSPGPASSTGPAQ